MAILEPPGKRARHDATGASGATAAADDDNDVSFQSRLGRWGTSVRRVRDANDGKTTLVAVTDVKKGKTIVAEPPLAAVQALANRGRFLACAHCLAPAGEDPARHLALAAGRVSRRDLVAAASEAARRGIDIKPLGIPSLPRLFRSDTSTRGEAPTPCRNARGGCLDVFCGVACRDAARGWHALTCIGCCGEGSPIFEFRVHVKRSHESFLLAADALARAIADAGGSDGIAEGEEDSTNQMKNNQEPSMDDRKTTHSTYLFAGLPGPTERWWDAAASVTVGEAAKSDTEETAAKNTRRAARRAETLREQIEDAYQLLFMAWGRARGLRGDSRLETLLSFDTFERLVAAVDRSAQPLASEHPGVAYARAATVANQTDATNACAALREAAREAGNTEAGPGDISGESDDPSEEESSNDSDEESDDDSEDESDDEETYEAPKSEETAVAAPETVTTAAALAGDDGILDAVELATSSFPRLAALALAPIAALVGHSCLPNAQVEVARAEETVHEDDGSECGGLRVALVALRDVRAGEEITVARVPVGRPASERHTELASRFGFERNCACARCVYELADDVESTSLTADDLCSLADQASEEGRHEDAEKLALDATRVDLKNETNARHKQGVALLGQGKWAEAHATWRQAFALCPENPTLLEQARKDKAYKIDFANVTETNGKSGRMVELHPSGVFGTHADDSPFLSEEQCRVWIGHAEAAAAASQGGWTTSRHYAVPTTDLPVHLVPFLLPLWNGFVHDTLGPFLHRCFPDIVMKDGQNVRVHDAFVVRYDAQAQRFLPTHVDQSSISVTLALNGLDEYDGGGTFFPHPINVTARPDVGRAVAFRGDLKHAGSPVTKGVRYIVAAFLFTV